MPLNRREYGGTVAVQRPFLRRIDAHGRYPRPYDTSDWPLRFGDFCRRRNRLAAAGRAGCPAGPGRHLRRCGSRDRCGGQYLDQADRGHEQQRHAAVAARLPIRGVLRRVLQEPQRPGRAGRPDAAPGQLARVRIHHRRIRAGRDQQPRDRRRRRDQRHPQRRHHVESRYRRPRYQDRSRVAAGQAGQAAQGGEVRRIRTSCGWANG